jgi:hypothetical protein
VIVFTNSAKSLTAHQIELTSETTLSAITFAVVITSLATFFILSMLLSSHSHIDTIYSFNAGTNSIHNSSQSDAKES